MESSFTPFSFLFPHINLLVSLVHFTQEGRKVYQKEYALSNQTHLVSKSFNLSQPQLRRIIFLTSQDSCEDYKCSYIKHGEQNKISMCVSFPPMCHLSQVSRSLFNPRLQGPCDLSSCQCNPKLSSQLPVLPLSSTLSEEPLNHSSNHFISMLKICFSDSPLLE